MKRIVSISTLLFILTSTLSTVLAAPPAQGAPVTGSYGDPGDMYLTYSVSGADFSGDTDGDPHIAGTYTGSPIQFSGTMIVSRGEGMVSFVTMKASLGDQSVQWPKEGEDNRVEGKTVELPFSFGFTVPPDYESSAVLGTAFVQACGGACGTYAIEVRVELPAPSPTVEGPQPTVEPSPSPPPSPTPQPGYRLSIQPHAPTAPLHFTIRLEKQEGSEADAPYVPVPGAKLKVFAPGYQGNENRLADEFVAPGCTNCQTRQTDMGTLASLSDPGQPILMETDGGGTAQLSLFLDFGKLGNRVPQRDAPLEIPIAVEAWVDDGGGGERVVAQAQQSASLEAIGVVLAITYQQAQMYDVGGSPLPRTQGPLESYYDDPGTRDGPRTLRGADRVLADWPGNAAISATGATSGVPLVAGDLLHAGDRVMINACDMVTNRIVDGLPAGAPGVIWVKVRFFDGLKAKVGVNGGVCRTPVTFGESPESSGWLSSGEKFFYWSAKGTMNAIVGHFVWPYKIVSTMSSVGNFLAWATGNEAAGWSPVYIKVKSALVVQFDEEGNMHLTVREGEPDLLTEVTGEAGQTVAAGSTARVADGLSVEVVETGPDAASEADLLLADLYGPTGEFDPVAGAAEGAPAEVSPEPVLIDVELPTPLLAGGCLLAAALLVGVAGVFVVTRRSRRRAAQPVAARSQAGPSPVPAHNPAPQPVAQTAPARAPAAQSPSSAAQPARAPAPVVWRLVAVEGPHSGQTYPFARQIEIGRSAENYVPLQDEQASRRHAMIHQQDQGYLIIDVSSRNGTFVNGTRISQPTWIGNRDRIRIGGSVFEVHVGRVAPAPVDTPTPDPIPMAAAPVQAGATCPQCGHSLQPGVRFCGTCGAAVDGQGASPPPPAYAQAPVQARPAPQPAAGQVVGVVPLIDRRKGLMGSESYNLVLTLQHLVFARITTEMIRAASDQAKQDAKTQGKGLFGQWGAITGASRAIVEGYYQMPVEAILRQHPDNFSMAASQVRKVTFSHNNVEMSMPDEMVIHAAGKVKFQLKGTTIGDARKALRQVLGDRVK